MSLNNQHFNKFYFCLIPLRAIYIRVWMMCFDYSVIRFIIRKNSHCFASGLPNSIMKMDLLGLIMKSLIWKLQSCYLFAFIKESFLRTLCLVPNNLSVVYNNFYRIMINDGFERMKLVILMMTMLLGTSLIIIMPLTN